MRRRWIRLGAAGGGIAAGCVVLGGLLATDTLGAIDPRYRSIPWRTAERLDYSMFEQRPTQAPVGVYSPILPWERWAPPPPEPRFVHDDPALLGADAYEPRPVRRAREEPDLEADAPWYREEAEPAPEPVVAERTVVEPTPVVRQAVMASVESQSMSPEPPPVEAAPTAEDDAVAVPLPSPRP